MRRKRPPPEIRHAPFEQSQARAAEKKIAHQRLPEGERERWIDTVKDVVLKQPALAKRLF